MRKHSRLAYAAMGLAVIALLFNFGGAGRAIADAVKDVIVANSPANPVPTTVTNTPGAGVGRRAGTERRGEGETTVSEHWTGRYSDCAPTRTEIYTPLRERPLAKNRGSDPLAAYRWTLYRQIEAVDLGDIDENKGRSLDRPSEGYRRRCYRQRGRDKTDNI